MKFTTPTLSSLLLVSTLAMDFQPITKLRGADLSTPPKKMATVKLSRSEPVVSLFALNDADALAACQPGGSPLEESDCNASNVCTWCESKAVSSSCYPVSMVGRLAAGVFECASKDGFVVSNGGGKEMIASKMSHAREEADRVVSKSEFFNLKDGITLTLTADSVDKQFCDPNSEVSLAGYMNVKGSQFDTQNDKNLFFWMFEKRTTSLIPAKPNDAKLETSWNWPWSSGSDSDSDSAGSKSADLPVPDSDTPESSTTLASDEIPLVIWLTGGPGCSSSLALLTENGPCTVNNDGETTSVNPYSWTESAHVLWLDQPADVGYSYGQDNDTNEEMISEDAYYFIQAFLQSEDGQKYKNNPLYIVGESYGGHYAPAIAHRIWRGNKDLKDGLLSLNLKGLAVGNGLTNPEIQYQYYSEMAFKNSHNMPLISEDTYNMMKSAEPICAAGIKECNNGDGMLNTFSCQVAFLGCNMALTTPYRATGLNPYDIRKPCGDNPLCYDFSHVEKFMNADSTKKALHVDSQNPTWQTCNMMINLSFHTDWMKDFSGYVADLVNDGIPALIYAGDVDFICNYLGNKAWTTALEWKHGAEFQAAEDKDWNNGAGLVRSANGLTFLQVYDAGHMVPSDQPEHALAMITQFLNGEAF